jgi:cytochrome c-type biogenesis protein CcmH/NrfG
MANSKIKVADGALVADFTSAEPPLLWRMELSRVHAVAFRLVQSGRAWELGTESAKGEFAPIARFTDRKQAEKALRAMSRALRSSGRGLRFFKALGYVALGVVLTVALIALDIYLTRAAVQQPAGSAVVSENNAAPPAPVEGKPLSADQVLQMPNSP